MIFGDIRSRNIFEKCRLNIDEKTSSRNACIKYLYYRIWFEC
jgi:hypothetical protein